MSAKSQYEQRKLEFAQAEHALAVADGEEQPESVIQQLQQARDNALEARKQAFKIYMESDE